MTTDRNQENDRLARELDAVNGHPGTKWSALESAVKDSPSMRTFASVSDRWLDLMWCLGQYRRAQVCPIGMGKLDQSNPLRRLDGVYRGKGHWFSTLISWLLQNQTGHELAPIQTVRGYSQDHQIDIAWPARLEEPLVCAEVKLTGAPGFTDTVPRRAMADWSNRRKELKFAATDLKLARRREDTSIEHWGVWRKAASPRFYVLWGARLDERDRIGDLIGGLQSLIGTYLDGAGLVTWRENAAGSGYELVGLPSQSEYLSIDSALWEMGSEINRIAPEGQSAPPPANAEEHS